ncbi:MAG: hypothetical protein M3Q15_05015 [Pseudomonadota bacterium]|nr:hypothetical protein [Pseudomonadota bacterium]
MRYFLAAAALSISAPAYATQGLLCRPITAERPGLSLVIGAGGIAGASLDEGGQWISTMDADARLILTQAWIDGEQVMADIADPKWDRIAELRARFDPPAPRMPRTARGTLTLRGRVFPVRCEEN